MRSILFVCTANICRSPMAEGALRKLLENQGVAHEHEIDSAGTHDYQAGKPPFHLAVESAAEARLQGRPPGIAHRAARGLRPLRHDPRHGQAEPPQPPDRGAHPLQEQDRAPAQLRRPLLRPGDSRSLRGEAKDFELALDMVEDGCRGLAHLLAQRGSRRSAS
jgi:protein-tyrosine phosphatase